MNWYYVENGERKGPVQDSGLGTLVEQGAIGEETLVWHEGMPDWQPYRELLAGAPAAPPPTVTTATTGLSGGVCSRCGRAFPADQFIRLEGANVCPDCRPLVLQSMKEGVLQGNSRAEEVRRAHISHEASVKSVGILYFLGAGVLVPAGAVLLFAPEAAQKATGFALMLLGGFQLFCGIGIRKLRPWARIVAGVLSGIGLLGFPLGTIINGYILYLLFSKKGTTVFSEEYQRVIAATPHVKYRTSIIVWIFLALLLLLIVGAVVFAVFGMTRRM